MSVRLRSLAVRLGLVTAASLVLATAAVSSPSAEPNLIKNGGFEQPLVGAGGYTLVSAGQNWGGWKVVGGAGNVAPISTTFQQNGISFVAKAGHQWLDLTGTSNRKIGVAQTIKTAPGASYRLTFAVGNVVDPGGLFGLTSAVNVLVNGHKVLAATNKEGGKAQAWKTFALTVKATKAVTTIEFQNGDGGSDNDNGLDAVSLVKR